MLPLAEIKQRHDGCFLVLWGISLQYFVDEAVVLLGEFERDRGIVVVGIAMLNSPSETERCARSREVIPLRELRL